MTPEQLDEVIRLVLQHTWCTLTDAHSADFAASKRSRDCHVVIFGPKEHWCGSGATRTDAINMVLHKAFPTRIALETFLLEVKRTAERLGIEEGLVERRFEDTGRDDDAWQTPPRTPIEELASIRRDIVEYRSKIAGSALDYQRSTVTHWMAVAFAEAETAPGGQAHEVVNAMREELREIAATFGLGPMAILEDKPSLERSYAELPRMPYRMGQDEETKTWDALSYLAMCAARQATKDNPQRSRLGWADDERLAETVPDGRIENIEAHVSRIAAGAPGSMESLVRLGRWLRASRKAVEAERWGRWMGVLRTYAFAAAEAHVELWAVLDAGFCPPRGWGE